MTKYFIELDLDEREVARMDQHEVATWVQGALMHDAEYPSEIDVTVYDNIDRLIAGNLDQLPMLGVLTIANSDEQGSDFILNDYSCWIEVDELSAYIVRADEGLSVDIYATGKECNSPIASTWALFNEAWSDDEEHGIKEE